MSTTNRSESASPSLTGLIPVEETGENHGKFTSKTVFCSFITQIFIGVGFPAPFPMKSCPMSGPLAAQPAGENLGCCGEPLRLELEMAESLGFSNFTDGYGLMAYDILWLKIIDLHLAGLLQSVVGES